MSDEQSRLDRAAIDWLLASDEPGVRLRVRRDLLDEQIADDAFTAAADGPKAARLLAGLSPDGAPGDGWGGG